jgi:hypothetical protein
VQSDAITPVQSVPQSIAAILSERKDRTKLSLSRYAAEAAEQAAEHRDKLEITQEAKHLSEIHRNLFPEANEQRGILSMQVLIGGYKPLDALPD